MRSWWSRQGSSRGMSSSHFDDIAANYDASLPAHVAQHYLCKRVAFLAQVCPAGSVLDVGCGTGALAERLSERGYRVVGVDPSPGMLEVMRRRAPGVEAVEAPGSALPFPAQHFDLVVSVATMHHIADADDVQRTLAEMVRVCRPAGRIVIWDHNPRNPYWPNLMARVPQDTGEERLISERELVTGLIEAGAQLLSVQQLGLVPDFIPRPTLPLASRIERLFERTPYLRRFAAHNVLVARRARGD